MARGRAHASAAVFASFGGHNFYRRHRLRHPDRSITRREFGRGDVLSLAELASIAGLPTGPAPTLLRARARAVSPPPGTPSPGPQVKPLGDAITGGTSTGSSTGAGGGGAGRGRPVGVAVRDARHHLHVMGATGSGKSTLLVRLILDDIRAHRGVVVVDPKGDLITDVLDRLPDPVRERVVLLDPDRAGPVPNLNPLARTAGPLGAGGIRAADALRVETLVAICRNVYQGWWGPRTDDVLRSACLTLLAHPDTRSLGDVPALLTDPNVRARHLRHVTDPVLRGFWHQYDHLSRPAQALMTAPLMNKLRGLLLRPFSSAVLGADQPASTQPSTRRHRTTNPNPGSGRGVGTDDVGSSGRRVDFGAALDGGIVLARIPKGSLGEEGTRLIGSIVVAHTWAAATARARQPADQRRDASLVLDECQNFLALPDDIADILAEARGLGLGLTLAHQNLAQLPTRLREGISANARNKLFFTVSPDDAATLARHTRPLLDEHDLSHLDAFHVAARLVHHGAETPAFTLRTRALPPRHQKPRHQKPGPDRDDDTRTQDSTSAGHSTSAEDTPAVAATSATGQRRGRRHIVPATDRGPR